MVFSTSSLLIGGLATLGLTSISDAAPMMADQQPLAPATTNNDLRHTRRGAYAGEGAWSTYVFNGGTNQYFIEARSKGECALTMENVREFAYDPLVNMLPANKPQVLGCYEAPNNNELKSKFLLSLPTAQCECTEIPGVNTVTSSLDKMCAIALGEDPSTWNNVFNCDRDNNQIQVWRFEDKATADRAAKCMNTIMAPASEFGGQRMSFFNDALSERRYLGTAATDVSNLPQINAWALPGGNAEAAYKFDIEDAGYSQGSPSVVLRSVAESQCVGSDGTTNPFLVACDNEQARFSIQRVDGSDDLVTIQSIQSGAYLSEVSNTESGGVFTTSLSLTLSGGASAQWGYQLIDGPARTSGDVLSPIDIAIPDPAFETFTFSDNCYIRSNDASSCADTVAELEITTGPNTLQCSAMGDNTVVGPKGSCYESDGSSITSTLEDMCFTALEISRPNIKYEFLGDLTDAATCETSKGWSFEDQTTCNLFAACLNLFYLQSQQTPSPSPSPTPAPTIPTPSPVTPAPTPSPPPTPHPTSIRDVKRYCKSIKCSTDCLQSNHCGWHTKKNVCRPYKNHPKIVDGPSVSPAIGC